ncbi:hypothetical protein PC128_g19511 [Phytophthora cactorum]|nr:hypothetical protein PC128_g19511 [Phytophthora cactorum]
MGELSIDQQFVVGGGVADKKEDTTVPHLHTCVKP